MSQITLSTVLTFVQAHIPNYPQAKCGAFVNVVLEEAYERLNQIEYTTFTTRTPTTSGTVNVTNNATSAAFSGTPLASTDGLRLIQIGDDATWYVLTYIANNSGSLSSVYAGTTNTTATYKIVYPTVSFGASVGRVLGMRREGYSPLTHAAGADVGAWLASGTTGQPLWYTPYAFDGSATPDDAARYMLKPFPDQMYGFSVQYLKRPTLIDPATATPTTEKVPIPQDFRMALLYGTLALCWSADDKEAGGWDAKAEIAMRKALGFQGQGVRGQRQGAFRSKGRMYAVQETPSE